MKIGLLFSWSLIVLFSLRFVDEFFKIDQVEFEGGMILNMGQLLCIPFLLTGVLLLIFKVHMKPVKASIDKILVDGDRIGIE